MPRGIGRRDHDRDQRLSFRERQGRYAPQPRRRPHRRDGAAADLRKPGGRAGRARLRRRLLRAERRQQPLRPGTRLRGSDHPHPLVARGGWLDLPAGSARCAAGRACRHLSRDDGRARRLCRQERLSRRADRAFRRHRFGAHGRRRGRCAGSGPRPLRRHAVPLHGAILPRRCGGMRAPARRTLRGGGDRAGGGRVGRHAVGALRRPRRGRDRGEHPGAGARRDPHGDQQQARPHGAHHRQQVGDVGGLRHALRRHVRRLFRPEGRLQDRRVRDGALAQPEAGWRVSRDPGRG